MRSEVARLLFSLCSTPLHVGPLASWTRYALAIIALLVIVTINKNVGATETYTGLLIPDTLSPPIPVVVELEQARSKLSGHITTSAPLTSKGRITIGERQRSACNFKSDIGAGRTIAFHGYCLSTTIEGAYTITFPDGSLRRGTYRLSQAESEKPDPKKHTESGEPLIRSATVCLSANSACLAACPRGDYNAEFVCSNRCRQRLAGCRAKAAATLPSPAASPVVPENY